jgi:hypothetical protein
MNEAIIKRNARRGRSSWLRTALLVAATALSVLAVALAGCGSDDESSDGSNGGNGDSAKAFPPNVVRDSEIEAQEAGSPERGLLEWWQAFQFSDAQAVIGLTSKSTLAALGERDLAKLVKTRGQGLQGVEVLGATTSGNTSSVRVGLLTFQPDKPGDPPPTTPTGSKPTTLTMKKVGDKWLFGETAYLKPMVENLKNAGKKKPKKKTETTTTPTETVPTETEVVP